MQELPPAGQPPPLPPHRARPECFSTMDERNPEEGWEYKFFEPEPEIKVSLALTLGARRRRQYVQPSTDQSEQEGSQTVHLLEISLSRHPSIPIHSARCVLAQLGSLRSTLGLLGQQGIRAQHAPGLDRKWPALHIP